MILIRNEGGNGMYGGIPTKFGKLGNLESLWLGKLLLLIKTANILMILRLSKELNDDLKI